MLRRRSPRFSVLATFVALAVLFGAAAADTLTADDSAPAGAQTWELAAEQDLLARHNAHRASEGLPPLVRDPALDAIAREWTLSMTDDEVLHHRGGLREIIEAQVTTQWRRIGENVGWGPSSSWLHDAFVASPGHNANILGDYNRVGIGAALDDDGDLWVTVNFLDGPEISPTPDVPDIDPVDGWIVDDAGVIQALGNAPMLGDLASVVLSAPIVGMASTPSGNGYWLVAQDGGIFAFGDARFFGSTGNITLNQPIVGMAATPTGNGYWLVAQDGGVFTFGDATYQGAPTNWSLDVEIHTIARWPGNTAPAASSPHYWVFGADGQALGFGAGTDGVAGTATLTNVVAAAVR